MRVGVVVGFDRLLGVVEITVQVNWSLVCVDLDLQMRRVLTLRLDGIDTHETYGVDHDSEEYEKGVREAEYVREWLPSGGAGEWPLTVSISERGKYGRYIATVERGDGAVLNEDLRERFAGVGT